MNRTTWPLKGTRPPTAGIGWSPRTVLATLPADLRQWVNEATLVGWILEIVCDALEGYSPAPAFVADGPPVPMMLTALTYCYATGRYASEDIEAATAADRTIHYLCMHQFVTASAIRRFRRAHRALIHSCLTSLHRKAWRHRFGGPPSGCQSSAESSRLADSDDDRFAYRLAAAAEEKIQQAILADTIALDD